MLKLQAEFTDMLVFWQKLLNVLQGVECTRKRSRATWSIFTGGKLCTEFILLFIYAKMPTFPTLLLWKNTNVCHNNVYKLIYMQIEGSFARNVTSDFFLLLIKNCFWDLTI